MAYYDYIVKHDFEKETTEELTKKILYSLYINRIKNKKPVVTFVGGDSGEGKSMTVERIIEILFEIQGISFIDYLEEVNVFTPIQYPEKIDKLLHDPELKKVNAIATHEAREVIKASNWRSFLNTAIGDVNAMSRSIKRLMFFIVSQFIRDIDPSIRYTLTYYCTVTRPLGHKARIKFSKVWKDDRDLENPKIRKRRIRGLIKLPDGRYKQHKPDYLEISLPSKEIRKKFDYYDTLSKKHIIKRKLEKLISEMKKDLNIEDDKIEAMVAYYTEDINRLNTIGEKKSKKWKIDKKIKQMHDLTSEEVKIFQEKINEKLNK